MVIQLSLKSNKNSCTENKLKIVEILYVHLHNACTKDFVMFWNNNQINYTCPMTRKHIQNFTQKSSEKQVDFVFQVLLHFMDF